MGSSNSKEEPHPIPNSVYKNVNRQFKPQNDINTCQHARTSNSKNYVNATEFHLNDNKFAKSNTETKASTSQYTTSASNTKQVKSYIMITDENKTRYHEWGTILLHFMGSLSQEILENLVFNNENDKNDFNILIQKFDSYQAFYGKVKSENESIANYIEKLKMEAIQNIKNVDATVKQKIAMDIQKLYKERFIAIATSKLPNFNFEITFQHLTLAEIIFLWNVCKECYDNINKNCKYCGLSHSEGQCPALGKECNKCKKRNHFSKCCPGFMYCTDCYFCGGDHMYKQCPAFGETCSKCFKLNHFSWQCFKVMIPRNCRFCGMKHLMDRTICPARYSVCCICKQTGHYEVKCSEQSDKVAYTKFC